MTTITAWKRRIFNLLKAEPLAVVLAEIARMPPGHAVNPLIAALFGAGTIGRWHAVTALGQVMATLAASDMEAARIVMRRLMWSLNDESGGIGWGAPEAMGEIMACHDGLAAEYSHMLVAYMREDGFFLELPPLQRGLMWALGRLAAVRPNLLLQAEAVRYLAPYLDADDPEVRGLAARALGRLGPELARTRLEALTTDPAPVTCYEHETLQSTTVGRLAREALAARPSS